MPRFQVVSEYDPAGDQPQAIDALEQGLRAGRPWQCLMGATGTGKTFTMANLIERAQRPTLVLSHNKTLAAQLYEEFKALFPHNSVNYFVSFYDYYQPEAYIPQRDIYIEKDASRNDDLDRLRLAASTALVSRSDVIVVASVSCIYGIGSPWDFLDATLSLFRGQQIERAKILDRLAALQYQRTDMDLDRGKFRVRGDVIELVPGSEEHGVRIELFGDEVDRLSLIHPVSGQVIDTRDSLYVYPAVQYVLPDDRRYAATSAIRAEMKARVAELKSQDKLLEAQRLQARCWHDIEMLEQAGFCPGIENYSRHLDGREAGSRPYSLFDYFRFSTERHATDWMLLIDESHVTLPQVRAMWHGDRSRKTTLVEHGFRLPSALDNRPMTFDEVMELSPQAVLVSATPGDWELEKVEGEVVEQIIRPTGLLDPVVEVRSAATQVPDLMDEIQKHLARGGRSLVTTLTKRLAEDLAAYLEDAGVACRYMHSDIDTLDRVEILRDLRLGSERGGFDVLVGVNLLREGLDLPEVSFVAILDADKEGFLRSARSLIQQIGRAARNSESFVVLYGDKITPAMRQALDETERRRSIQMAYNQEHDITPETIDKAIRRSIEQEVQAHHKVREAIGGEKEVAELQTQDLTRAERIEIVRADMLAAAEALEFEKAGLLRDRLRALEKGEQPVVEKKTPAGSPRSRKRRGK